MSKQVMEQALEALCRTLPCLRVAVGRAASPDGYSEAKADLDAAGSAIAALKEAIKQAGEPVGVVVSLNGAKVGSFRPSIDLEIGTMLYTSAPTIPEDIAKDAARYRWLRKNREVTLLTNFFGNGCTNRTIGEVDAKIDAMLAAAPSYQGDKP